MKTVSSGKTKRRHKKHKRTKKKRKRKKKEICEVCKKNIGVKRITLNNAKFIHHGNYSIDRWKPNCADYLRERPREISDLVMGLYAKKKSLLNKIISIFYYDKENNPEIIEYKLNLLNQEAIKVQSLRKKVYDYWPDYPPDWEERRQEAISRAKEKCQECKTDWVPHLHVHHIKYLGRGGSNKISNLIALCESCHESKHGGRSFNYDDTYSTSRAYPERINTINKAIKLKKNLAFNYYKVKQKKWMKRKVMPDELTKEIWIDGKTKFFLDNLYLVGHCHLRDDKRTFRLDRMKGLMISK